MKAELKVQYIDHMGSDLSVVNAAKASFGKAEQEFKPQEHTRLINYLAKGITQAEYQALIDDVADNNNTDYVKACLDKYRHQATHFSPFCHVSVSLRLQAPIAIHAQFMKHTIGVSHNTVSRRYVADTPSYYVPQFRQAPQGNIKQGSGEILGDKEQYNVQRLYELHVQETLDIYDSMIRNGIAPEQARFILPQGVMTEWVTTGTLYAWARIYNQRIDSHAQKESQELAKMIGDLIAPLYPVSWQALTA